MKEQNKGGETQKRVKRGRKRPTVQREPSAAALKDIANPKTHLPIRDEEKKEHHPKITLTFAVVRKKNESLKEAKVAKGSTRNPHPEKGTKCWESELIWMV